MWMELIKKELSWITERCNNQSDHIRPDIIIHKRKQPWRENNLCVFEIKKLGLSPCDIAKLELLTNQNNDKLQYQYWIWLSNFTKEKAQISVFINWKSKHIFYFYNKTWEIQNN